MAKPRWFRFSLRTLFALIAICAVSLVVFARNYRYAIEQHQVIGNIGRQHPAEWGYEWCRGPEYWPRLVPVWLMNVLGDDFFGNVIAINFLFDDTAAANWSDGDFDHLVCDLELLPKLEVIGFEDGTATESQMERLQQRFPRIRLIHGGFHKTRPF